MGAKMFYPLAARMVENHVAKYGYKAGAGGYLCGNLLLCIRLNMVSYCLELLAFVYILLNFPNFQKSNYMQWYWRV